MALGAPRLRDLDFTDTDWIWHGDGPLIPIQTRTWELRDNNCLWGYLPSAVGDLPAGYYALAIYGLSEVDLYPTSASTRADTRWRRFGRRTPLAHFAWADDRATAEAARAYDGHDIRRVDDDTVR